MFDKPEGLGAPTVWDHAGGADSAPDSAPEAAPDVPVKRPARWSPTNWPVRWKVLAIALIPLLLAAVFGGLRIYDSAAQARQLRVAADRAQLIPSVEDYLSALEAVLFIDPLREPTQQARADFDARSAALLAARDDVGAEDDVRAAVTRIVEQGKALVDGALSGNVDLASRVTGFSPVLLTAETAITDSVRVEDETLRQKANGLARAVGTRGQMTIQRMLVQLGGSLPEPYLRSSMALLAGTEPSNVLGLTILVGNASEEAQQLLGEMNKRMAMVADPSVPVVGSPDLLASIEVTDSMARELITATTDEILSTVDAEATAQRTAAIRDAAIVIAVFLIALLAVWWVARTLTRPLRRLRDGALQIAHRDLAAEIERVKAGDESEPAQLPIYTTEEVGQVAHAVDELHTQALLLAGDEARLRVMVDDMFETLSRRNKTLVDQQLALIDRLERNEEDPDRLDSLFRLDHLATRMRRNGANLLVLAGAQATREQGPPIELASVISAAASEVEDYARVETGMVPDCEVVGPVGNDVVHLLAELIDNALRYSPPNSPVRVTAVHTSDNGVLIDVNDLGLGMTDSDLRVANMRLNAGGQVSPDSTRHMGLFVVGRLAREHGMTVRLLPGTSGSGTLAQVYLPPELLVGFAPAEPVAEPESVWAAPYTESAPAGAFSAFDEPSGFAEPTGFAASADTRDDEFVARPDDYAAGRELADGLDDDFDDDYDQDDEDAAEAAEASVTLLPRRRPGATGITAAPADRPYAADEAAESEAPHQWWTPNDQPAEPAAPVNTAGFFSSRRKRRRDAVVEQPEPVVDESVEEIEPEPVVEPEPEPQPEPVVVDDTDEPETGPEPAVATDAPAAGGSPDLIYQNMVTELLDPDEVRQLAVPQDWKSVWDNGWAAAAEAEQVPIESRTDHGLPVRNPGARLIPGGSQPPAGEQAEDDAAAPKRDPDAIRNSMSNHFGGVRAARTHVRETSQGFDAE